MKNRDLRVLRDLNTYLNNMKALLNIYVSRFDNYKSVKSPSKISLGSWLTSDSYAEQVKKIRASPDKAVRDELKSRLPAITPSGLFSKRGEKYLIEHSGFIQFDIDGDHNPGVENFEKLRAQIGQIKNVSYVGLSVSGNGLWGLVPVKYPEKHKEHFRALEKAFLKLGITIDPAPANVASLRGYSYDPGAVFRDKAKPFASLDRPPRKKPRASSHRTKQDVENLISQIHAKPVDVTEGYETWLKIGFALSSEFGEEGRRYFHEVSKYHLDYDEGQTDQKYDSCLASNGQGVTIASFFHILFQYGLTAQSKSNPDKRGSTNTLPRSPETSGAEYGTKHTRNTAIQDFSNP